MPDDDGGCVCAIRPTGSFEHIVYRCAGRESLNDADFRSERSCRLPRTYRRTCEHLAFSGQALTQPRCHLRRLLATLGGQFALEVALAVFGLSVSPEDELHAGSLRHAARDAIKSAPCRRVAQLVRALP